MILIILIFLILLCIVKVSNNNDLIKANVKTPEDNANVKNAKKVFRKAKYFIFMLVLSIIILISVMLCQFTTIDTFIIDYFSTDFYKEDFFNINYCIRSSHTSKVIASC